jgi:hypothetical protein
LRTTITGQWACPTTLSETLPKRARRTPPSPRLSITIGDQRPSLQASLCCSLDRELGSSRPSSLRTISTGQ